MSETVIPNSAPRLASIDAYRGVVMFLMMAEVMDLSGVARAVPGNAFWSLLGRNQTHAAWVGCTLHDLIQPSFSFLVGVALPFSLASRRQDGRSRARQTLQTLRRALVLILLGVFLRSLGRAQTNWTFEDTLTQIGLGYPLLYWCGLQSVRRQWLVCGVILAGYWAAWIFYPLPAPGFDYASVNVPPGWSHHASGWAAHWNMNASLGAAFDRWFLNLFPRAQPFVGNAEGYLTLNFIPTLATMILGLVAGGWLRSALAERQRLQRMLLVGAGGIILGLALHGLGICPLVKKIWTPAWTLFSGGICFLFLALLHSVIDEHGWRRWAFPFVVIGANSIAAYLLAHLAVGFVIDNWRTHFGEDMFACLGGPYVPVLRGAMVLAVFWLVLLRLYQRKIFIRI